MSIIISISWMTKLKHIKELKATISKRAGEQNERTNERTEPPESSKEISSSKQSHHLQVWLDIQVLEGAGHAHLHVEGDT